MDTSGIQSQKKDGTRLGAISSIFYFIVIVITTFLITFFYHLFYSTLSSAWLESAGFWLIENFFRYYI